MNDVYTVYDLIEILRLKNGMSSRRLAMSANVSTATLASLMNRQPPTIAIETLDKIAGVFGVKWYELLNMPSSVADNYMLEKRIPVDMQQDDIAEVGSRLTNDSSFMSHVERLHRFDQRESRAAGVARRETASSLETAGFKNSLFFVLDRLNEDGLMEAMRRILAVADDPKYRKGNL